ncbi:hypothetical protein ACNE9Y_29600, partial [Pseudomonas sp. NY11226]|uniref:hypothetical protein n=1 Tax=Pseudomonas sp. NY11226 TaxID=3400362 RepID=UPI003A858D23
PAYSASAKVICFIIEKLGDWCPGILPNQEVFFRISLGQPLRLKDPSRMNFFSPPPLTLPDFHRAASAGHPRPT